MLCLFVFMKIVGINQQYFSCCKAVLRQSQGLFSFSHHHGSEELEVHKKLRGVTPVDQRDIPYHVVSCSSIKYGVNKEEGWDVWSNGVCIPKKPLRLMSPAFLEVAEHLPANGK